MIYLGADHGGFELKEKIKEWLRQMELSFKDLGASVYEKEDDYPVFAFRLAQRVAAEEKLILGNLEKRVIKLPWKDRPKGILCCRSAAGMVIAANKVLGARAVAATNERSTIHSRQHNDANILALSGDWLDDLMAKKILEIWLLTEFEAEERHIRRLGLIFKYENEHTKNFL